MAMPFPTRPAPRALLTAAVRPVPVLLLFAALWGVYQVVLHPWLMTWGATPEEQHLALPGDAAGATPSDYFTRAITIDAPASAVWPWLLQIGQDRAGFYSNDWLENLFGADIHNAAVLHPEWQQRQIGETVLLVPRGYLGGLAGRIIAGQPDAAIGPRIWLLEPNQAIADTPARFVLIPIDDHRTRLLVREPVAANTPGGGPIGVMAGRLIWDPLHLVMVKRMLWGIKERAEGRPLTPPPLVAAVRAGWALAGLGLLGLFLARRGWRPWVLVPIGLMAPSLSLTGDLHGALAGFLAVGITVAGVLAFGRRWWPPYLLLASGVALVLLLAPDAYVAFGLGFAVLLGVALVAAVRRRQGAPGRGGPAAARVVAAGH